MMTPNLVELLDAAVEAARRGAAELESWRPRFAVREKSRADLVTDADTASQTAIKEYLLGRFPHHAFVGEEDCVGKTMAELRPAVGGAVWVVDPLDGTGNYAHGVPQYCVNIGLLLDGVPAVGVTLDPRLNELYTAATGHGAFLNGERLHVSGTPTLHDGLFSTGFPASYEAQKKNLAAWDRVAFHAQALRRTGSTAINMAYVAAGRFDGYWCYDNWPWDVLAGAVLIAEAGGKLTAADGTPFDAFRPDLIATNGHTHEELAGVLAGTRRAN